jgi:uncharacterized protein (DUF2062 family)
MRSRVWKVRYLRLVRRVHRLMRHPRLRKFGWWQPIRARLVNRHLWHPTRDTVAGALSVGLFFSMMPMPFQTLAAAAIAVRARVNIPFAVAACFVSNPLSEPFIRLSQWRLGGWLRENLGLTVPQLGQISLPEKVADFIMGFLMAGVGLALLVYPLVHLFSALLPETLPIQPPKFRKRRVSPKHDGAP